MEQGSFNLVHNIGHKGPVLRPRCIGRGRARTQIPFSIGSDADKAPREVSENNEYECYGSFRPGFPSSDRRGYSCYLLCDLGIKAKGKVIPAYAVKAYIGVEVWLHSFVTSALDGDHCQRHAHAALPREGTLLPVVRWVSRLQGRYGRFVGKESILPLLGFEPIQVAALLLELRVRIPPWVWMSVCCERCVFVG